MENYKRCFQGSIVLVVICMLVILVLAHNITELKEARNKAVESAYAWKERSELYQQRIVKEKMDKLDMRAKIFHLERKLKRLQSPVEIEILPNVI